MLNWNIFKVKFDKRESYAFEQMAYLLFCSELGNRTGLFRYKNQAGIETDPIKKGKEVIGFQAKYYDAKIAENKSDIIDSIDKAAQNEPGLTKILFYLNQEFSESSKKGAKKPQYQKEIECAARKRGIEIDWRVPSYFEIQLFLPENAYILNLFFCLEAGAGELMDELKKHSENLLQAIQTQILFDEKIIRIDRKGIVVRIAEQIRNNQSLIISGEGGCGKTAIIKEFYAERSQKIPFYVFKATELNVSHLNDIFHLTHRFTFEQFIECHKDEQEKIFVIDSAEKLADVENSDLLYQFINQLYTNHWSLLFTTRYSYLNDLQFHMSQTYRLSCQVVDVPLLDEEKLNSLARENHFVLPSHDNFRNRLKNLFYLNEYLLEYRDIDPDKDIKSFINIIWKKRIQNVTEHKDDLHLERERCFLHIAKTRCETGRFYVEAGDLSRKALSRLAQDEIIAYEEGYGGYFITHDIYEEWALNRLINREFLNRENDAVFYKRLGSSLAIRRAFRGWLSEQIYENPEDIREFVEFSFVSEIIENFWKDEVLVAMLLSDHAGVFFSKFEQEIIADDFRVLERIIFLLRIACKEIDRSVEVKDAGINYLFTQPKGYGWEVTINFISEYTDRYFFGHLGNVLPLLSDWVSHRHEGETCRKAGLLALTLLQKRAFEKEFYLDRKIEEEVLQIIYNSVKEIRPELSIIFQEVVDRKWIKYRDPYHELCAGILSKSYKAALLIKELPECVLKLCDLSWNKRKEKGRYEHSDMEDSYSISNDHELKPFPASALQTPVFWLLQSTAFDETINFIIDFTNKAVESYSQSERGSEVEKIVLHVEDDVLQEQYIDSAIWGMYRGVGSPHVPYLLQSVHMALEKILLSYVSWMSPEEFVNILKYILIRSKSASFTAIVASVLLANPEKLAKIALILFKTIRLFHYDTIRCMSENEAKTIYGIGCIPGKEFLSRERLKTCEDKHRQFSLEKLIFNYQFFGIAGATEEENKNLLKAIYSIIDQHKSEVQELEEEKRLVFGILLARMDRRNMKPEVHQEKDHLTMELNPQLSPELKKYSEQAMKKSEEYVKYTSLLLWSMDKIEGNDKAGNYPQYDQHPQEVVRKVKEVIADLEISPDSFLPTTDYIPSFACAVLLYFYSGELSADELQYCRQIVLERVEYALSDEYSYQISDGVEACVHTLPVLIRLFPEEKNDFKLLLLLLSFDVTPIGQYKRVCDYVLETFDKEKVEADDLKSFLYAYIRLKPVFNSCYKKLLHERGGGWQSYITKSDLFKAMNACVGDFHFTLELPAFSGLSDWSVSDIEILFSCIPTDTEDKELVAIVEKVLSPIAGLLVKNGEDGNIYLARIHLFQRLTKFILQRDVKDIGHYMRPLIQKMGCTEETAELIEAFIWAEDSLVRKEQFWKVWEELYQPLNSLCLNGGYHSSQLLIGYLLAWKWWTKGGVEWHSFGKSNLTFYGKIACEMGGHPAVLYSVARVLNTIGSQFTGEGINWIYEIVKGNRQLAHTEYESDTLFYLEQFMRKYLFRNKEMIRKDLVRKNRVITILDFMVERGSVQGYLLRENIL